MSQQPPNGLFCQQCPYKQAAQSKTLEGVVSDLEGLQTQQNHPTLIEAIRKLAVLTKPVEVRPDALGISELLDEVIPADGVGTEREKLRMRLHRGICELLVTARPDALEKLAVEFGYKGCERGWNIQRTLQEYAVLIQTAKREEESHGG